MPLQIVFTQSNTTVLLTAVMDRSNNAKQIKTSPDISNLQGNANAVRSRSAFPTCELSSPPAATWAPPSARPPATPSGRRTAHAWTRRAGRRTASAAATSAPPSSPSALRSQLADLTARDKGDFSSYFILVNFFFSGLEVGNALDGRASASPTPTRTPPSLPSLRTLLPTWSSCKIINCQFNDIPALLYIFCFWCL